MTFTSSEMPVRHWRRNNWFYRLEANINRAGCFMAPIGIVRFLATEMLQKRMNFNRSAQQKNDDNPKDKEPLFQENPSEVKNLSLLPD